MDSVNSLSIDVHHHSFPPAYIKYLEAASQRPGGWVTEEWTAQTACDYCHSKGIGVAILSCIPGGPHSNEDLPRASEFTRECNEYNAQLVQNSPSGSFGFFAHVTNLCEIDLTLKEIEYAFQQLDADGITLATSYHKDGRLHYLGDPLFTPIWDDLSARKAVVFVHPVPSANMAAINEALPAPAFEFPHETGRTAIDLITNPSNMLKGHAAGCKIILSHAGGDLPYLIDRVAGLMSLGPPSLRLKKSSEEILAEARRFYYETALSSSPMQLNALSALLGSSSAHILFGTDFPPAGVDAIDYFSRQLHESRVVSVQDMRRNTLQLFPRFRGQVQK
ncbi:uncharacterized protein A1O9_05432 [Exophiala aquamarina CBS 119918]|uniref:6-methylsalicylate decarboxylase n=1 Tax=Exophiala aquamarina CBS 119918 TaxID=1182545 RepID=A0A072PPS1_9EURO|nr:uncharacterized protein A1O9_05432 [Exophiala aquamarina CBS 119918]KEF57515.1 hypothetical protein A1O9_05432 [Exophiala aquamarina CBS 119918]